MNFEDWKAEAMRLAGMYAGKVASANAITDEGERAAEAAFDALSAHLDLMRPEAVRALLPAQEV